jgi:hypothetical protein
VREHTETSYVCQGEFILCQEQIGLSAFVANELSAFSIHQKRWYFELEESGGGDSFLI